MNWRIPVEAKLLLVVPGLRFNIALLQRVPVDASNFPALRFGVNIISVCRIGKYPESVAAIEIFPARVGDAARLG
jgi:hypothetical protein